MWSVGDTPYNLTELSRVFLALLCVRGLNLDPRVRHPDQHRRERVGPPPPPARADRLKILKLNRKH